MKIYRIILLLILALAACNGGGGGGGSATKPTLNLLAGNMSGVGSSDGSGAAARFNYPQSLASDSAGNLYVADTNNNTIRKISSAGVVSTFAGTPGVSGSSDGIGAAARFAEPAGIVCDISGNLFVADSGNNTIRKITATGVVSTLAGTAGVVGSIDGFGAAARFGYLQGLTSDGVNLYAADSSNHIIRKIAVDGMVTTVAGTAGVAGSSDGSIAARFDYPRGLTMDGVGNLYVADSNNNTIRKITVSGVVSALAGTAGVAGNSDGSGAAASFNYPQGIATDSAGNIYVADTFNYTIRKITAIGAVSTLAGTAGAAGSSDGNGTAAWFFAPYSLTSNSAGNLYVTDTYNHTIRKITTAGVVSTFAGAAREFGSSDGSGAAAHFMNPYGIASDIAGNLYVADSSNHIIRKMTGAGLVTLFAGAAGVAGSTDGSGAASRFYYPHWIASDNAGNLYVADTDNHTIRKITPAGVVSTFAGTAGVAGNSDGSGAAASFNYPEGLTSDSAGNLYVVDRGNNTIRKITTAGLVSTFAGTAGVFGSSDGSGTAARFTSPYGLARDNAGNLYVADTGNSTIRKITTAGVVSTLAGMAGMVGSSDGSGAAARFENPYGITSDGVGNLYVADTGNSTIRKITATGAVTTVVGVAGQIGFAPGSLPGIIGYPLSLAIYGNSLYITLYDGVAVVNGLP
ncbi:MAG: hypothetical protein Q7S51_10080 [Gallionellaceae bacterium]|nr:hypothetical protein [Gallionellaceae bacterium]